MKADGNVCVILLSEIVWEKFRCGTGFQEPFIVHFPDYNKGKRFSLQFTNGIVVKVSNEGTRIQFSVYLTIQPNKVN